MPKTKRSTITCAPLRSACRRACVSLCKSVVALHLMLTFGSTLLLVLNKHPWWSMLHGATYIVADDKLIDLLEIIQLHTISSWTTLGITVWFVRATHSLCCYQTPTQLKTVHSNDAPSDSDKPPLVPRGIRGRKPTATLYPTTHSLCKKT